VLKLICAVDHVVREVGKPLLVRDLGDFRGKSAEVRFLLDEESRTSNLCGCTGGFHTRCPAADDNDVARFAYLMLLIVFALCDCRVDRTADRAVDADTVSGASDVAGDTFPDITDIAKFYLVHPLRISDQPAADSDQVSVTSCK